MPTDVNPTPNDPNAKAQQHSERLSARAEIVSILSAAASPWAVVALVALLMLMGGCAVTEDDARDALVTLNEWCAGQVDTGWSAFCRNVGFDVAGPDPLAR